MSNDKKIQVFYDSECVICSRKVEDYKNLTDANTEDTEPVVWLDIYKNRAALSECDISFAAAKSALQVVDRQGQVYSGVKAHLHLWRQLERYRLLALIIERIPGLYHLCCLYYRCFISYRQIVNRRALLSVEG